MARIPEEESLERLVTAFGIDLRRHGADLLGRCPSQAPYSI